MKLTPSIIAGMQSGQELSDPDHPGLRVRCGASGVKVFFYRYKTPGGALRQFKLGEFPPSGNMTLAAAVKEWARRRTERERGIDPQAAKQASKLAEKQERERRRVEDYTVGDLLDDYLAQHVEPNRKGKGAAEVGRFLKSDDLKTIRKRPAIAVTRKEAADLIKAIRARGVPVLAGQIKTEIKAAYEHAMNGGTFDMAGNPFAFTLKGLVAKKRDRVLRNHELVALVPWMRKEYSEAVADALMITLYCGVRSGEVCEIEAKDIDEEADGMVWTIPSAKSKNKVSFRVMVPTQAAEIIRKRLSSYPSGNLFPSRVEGKPIQQKVLGVEIWAHSPDNKNVRYRNRVKCPVGDWGAHDLRRTCRTTLSALGCPVEVAEAILNHLAGGVRGHYDHYRFGPEKREWLQRWADHLDQLVNSQNVVPLLSKTAA